MANQKNERKKENICKKNQKTIQKRNHINNQRLKKKDKTKKQTKKRSDLAIQTEKWHIVDFELAHGGGVCDRSTPASHRGVVCNRTVAINRG